MTRRFALPFLTLAMSISAYAQNTTVDGTPVNTTIVNTAQSSFYDPSIDGMTTLNSNTVTTTVLPKPGFDLVYSDGTDGLMNGTVSPGNTVATAPKTVTGTVTAGGTYVTPYQAVNNGNTAQTITLSSDSGGVKVPASVQYYLDQNQNGILDANELSAGATTSLSLPYDDPSTTADEGIAYFIQVITLPTEATPGDQYAATPIGTGQGFDGSQPQTVTESATVLGLQYAVVIVANQPPVPADVTNAALVNTAGATAVSPLVATDDGGVSSYTIQTLPAPTSGVLYSNGTAVTAGQVITDPTTLSFDPADGFVGNATFDYTATDNLSLASSTNKNADGTVTSGPATYTIPVQAPTPVDLMVQKTNTTPTPTTWTDLPNDMIKPGVISYYFVKVTNNGPNSVTGAVLQDILTTTPDSTLALGSSIGCVNTGTTSGTNMCTTTNKPTATQLSSGYVLPTIAPGNYFEFYVGVTIPASPTFTTVNNTVTVTAPTGFIDTNTGNNTAQDVDRMGSPPIPNDATNQTLATTDGPMPLSPNVSATDDGTVTSFTMGFLPIPESGVLALNGVPVTKGQVISISQIGQLTFDPAPGFVGTATFTYQATDNDNLRSTRFRNSAGAVSDGDATYKIPVQPPLGVLSCTNTVYGLFGPNADTLSTVRAVDPSGNPGLAVASIPSDSQNVATFALSPDGKKIFITPAMSDGSYQLKSYDMITGVWTTLGTLNQTGATNLQGRPVRMAIDKNGNGYISASSNIWTFDANTGTLNPEPINLIFDGTATGLTPAPTLDDTSDSKLSGDFIADSDGNIYLIANPENAKYIDVYRLTNLTSAQPKVAYLSRIPKGSTDSALYAGMAALPNGIYGIGSNNTYTLLDLGALTSQVIKAGTGSPASTDLASCYYPTLRPSLSSSKVVTDITTSSTTTTKPGDTLEYTITIRNDGNIAADGVTFQDAIPAGTTYVAGSTTTNGSTTPDINGAFPYSTAKQVKSQGTDVANGTTTAVTVNTDRTVVVKFRVTVNAGVTTVSNQGYVTYNNTATGSLVPTTLKTDDPTPPGTQDPTVIGAGAKLTVTKNVSSKVVRITPNSQTDTTLALAPQQLTYTIRVTNDGSAPATNVVVSDKLPDGLTYVSATGTPALATAPTVNGQQLSFNIPALAAGASQTLSVVTTVAPTPNANQNALTNTATAQADAVTSVSSLPVVTDVLYLKLRKSVANLTRNTAPGNTAEGTPGDTLEYCIAFNNYSSVALPGFILKDQVPGNTVADLSGYAPNQGVQVTRGAAPAVTYTSAQDSDTASLTATGGDFGAGTLAVNFGSVAAGEQGQACFRVKIR